MRAFFCASRRAQPFSTTCQPTFIEAVSLTSAEVSSTVRFYADIAQLTQKPTPGRVELWDRVGTGAGLRLWPTSEDDASNVRHVPHDALITFAVSNFRTALRQVLRRGGRVGECASHEFSREFKGCNISDTLQRLSPVQRSSCNRSCRVGP